MEKLRFINIPLCAIEGWQVSCDHIQVLTMFSANILRSSKYFASGIEGFLYSHSLLTETTNCHSKIKR